MHRTGGVVVGRANRGEAKWYEDVEAAAGAGFKRKASQVSATEFALQLAQKVALDNQTNTLFLEAQKLISEIAAQGNLQLGPSLLYPEGLAHYQNGQDEQAIELFKQVLAAIDGEDDVVRLEFGPRP